MDLPSSTDLAQPKSSSLSVSLGIHMMLSGLISLWMMPDSCSAPMSAMSGLSMAMNFCAGSRPSLCIFCCRVSPSRYSMTR